MSSLADETRWMDAVDQAALVAKGDVTPRELLDAAIERMEAIDPAVHALTITWFDDARRFAADGDIPDGPFHGVPFLLKDLYTSFAGQTLSNGNVALKEAAIVDTTDTTLVSRYRAAGFVVAGRTNSPEMGSLPCTQPTAWGPTHNPWDLSRTPGGSSGGSAAAVAGGHGADRQRVGRWRQHPHPGVGVRPRRAQAEPGTHHRGPGARRGRPRRRALRVADRSRQRRAARRGARAGRRRHGDRAGPGAAVRRGARRRSGPPAHRPDGRPPTRRRAARRLRRRRPLGRRDAGGPRPRRRAGVAGGAGRRGPDAQVHGAVGDADGDGDQRLRPDRWAGRSPRRTSSRSTGSRPSTPAG